MSNNFKDSQHAMPGLNFDAPPDIRDLQFVFDTTFAGEQRQRMQLGSGSGIFDTANPNSATVGSGRVLVVQPNDGNNLRLDVLPGVVVTPAGNIISVEERVFGLPMATTANDVPCIVLLEYRTQDDPTTNRITDYNQALATRRVLAPVFDASEFDPNATNIDELQNVSKNMLKCVTLDTFNDVSKFTPTRLNDCVVLAIVTQVANPDIPSASILSVDMSNNVASYVRPWFSYRDLDHRSQIGTGTQSATNPHAVSVNELVLGNMTIFQQSLQHGVVVSRDRNVPGVPGKLCAEFIDAARVFTDSTGAITNVTNARYVRLTSYPLVLVGIRENELDGSESVPDNTVTARTITGAIVPGTNIVALGRTSVNDVFDSTKGFTIYYTSAEASRPPALPHELSLVANNTIQFQAPTNDEIFITGGAGYNALSATSVAMGVAGPFPLRYKVWLDASRQYLLAPQVLFCAKVVETVNGVGTATQSFQYPLYGSSRIRVGLLNAPEPVQTSMFMTVEITGKDVNSDTLVEEVTISGSSVLASPRSVAWDPSSGQLFQLTSNVFSEITSWRVTDKFGLGSDAHVMLWAEIEPTTTAALDDALPVASVEWNGLGVSSIRDIRPVVQNIRDAFDRNQSASEAGLGLIGALTNTPAGSGHVPIASEDMKRPVWQDNVLSKRIRSNPYLRSVRIDETLVGFDSDGQGTGAEEWYYSRAIKIPEILQTAPSRLIILLNVDDKIDMQVKDLEGDTIVEAQLTSISGVTASSSSWLPLTSADSPLVRELALSSNYAPASSPYFKLRLRILSKYLKGYSLMMRTG